MNIKKIFSVLLLILIAFSFSGCGESSDIEVEINDNNSEYETENFPTSDVYLGTIKGSAEIGLLKLMQLENEEKTYNAYHFKISGSSDEIASEFLSNNIQIAIIPTELASVLYNKTNGNVQIAAINSYGSLYILENGNSSKTIKDLQNKTIYAAKDSVSEYILNYILNKNSVENVKIEYKDISELVSLTASKEGTIAVLPEPQASEVTQKNSNVKLISNITQEWELINNSKMASSCVAVQKEYAKKHPRVFGHFLQEYYGSINNVSKNPSETASLAKEFEAYSKTEAVEKSLENLNIVYIDGEEMQNITTNYLTELFNLFPDSIGGKVPEKDFFYTPKEKYAINKK